MSRHPIDVYRVRVQACLAATLALLIAVVRFWPQPGDSMGDSVSFRVYEQDRIQVEDVQVTRQALQRLPPPAPPIPVLVPDEVMLDAVELDLVDRFSYEGSPSVDLLGSGGRTGEAAAASISMIGPRTIRFVEPEYPSEARRSRIRAELQIEVLVDEQGRVRETRIVERFLFQRDGGAKTPVDVVGYGLEEAAVSAAERWVFRPATRDGEAVSSYTTLTFSFGV